MCVGSVAIDLLMKLSLFSLLLSLCFMLFSLSPCSGQMNLGGQQRCVSLNSNVTDLPTSCERFYSPGGGYFNGSEIISLQMALLRISRIFQSESNPCVDLMENYLCHYYFPLCNLTTGETTLVCNSSCALLVNNENCSDLRTIANEELEDDDIVPPDDVCLQTHSSYINPPVLSGNCLSIEDILNESLPLTCIEIPDETCLSQITYSSYAPAAIVYTDELSNEIRTILRQLDPLNSCRGFLTFVMCAHRFPACNATTGRILPLCIADCPDINEIVAHCTMEFYMNSDYPLTFQLFDSFACESLSYLNFPLQYIETDPNECTEFMLGIASTPGPTGSDNNVAIGVSVSSVLVVCFAVVITILLVVFVRQRKIIKHAARHNSSNDYTEPPSMLSCHIQNDSRLPLDLLVSSNSSSPYLMSHRRNLEGENILQNRRSLLLEVNDFLQYVKEKFSEVLLPVDTITKQELIGKGTFGIVHKGEMIASDGTIKAVAIKTIKSGSLDAMKDLVAESSIMKTFHHPNVLPLLGVCINYDDEDMLKIVMPFMANGDLKTFLKDSRVTPNNTQEYPQDLSEEVLMRMCFDIAKGMEYLAQKRYIHRDLAGRNCMVDTLLRIKIADFGLAKDVYSTEYYRIDKHTTLPVKWMSLESLLDGYFDEKTDVWSYGITCWEVFSLGRLPYPGVNNVDVITLLKSGQRLEQPELCPSEMNELITSTWLENPDERPTFATIVQSLRSICNFTETTTIADTDSIIDTEETAESSNYISILPK